MVGIGEEEEVISLPCTACVVCAEAERQTIKKGRSLKTQAFSSFSPLFESERPL